MQVVKKPINVLNVQVHACDETSGPRPGGRRWRSPPYHWPRRDVIVLFPLGTGQLSGSRMASWLDEEDMEYGVDELAEAEGREGKGTSEGGWLRDTE